MDYLKRLFPKYDIKQLLPKYDIKQLKGRFDGVEINYDKLNDIIEYTDNYMREHIDRFKFIHDNIDYIIEMILANGFLRSIRYQNMFIKNDVYISVYYDVIRINNQSLDNPETMFDDLRKFIGIDIPYKHVIKNE